MGWTHRHSSWGSRISVILNETTPLNINLSTISHLGEFFSAAFSFFVPNPPATERWEDDGTGVNHYPMYN